MVYSPDIKNSILDALKHDLKDHINWMEDIKNHTTSEIAIARRNGYRQGIESCIESIERMNF